MNIYYLNGISSKFMLYYAQSSIKHYKVNKNSMRPLYATKSNKVCLPVIC